MSRHEHVASSSFCNMTSSQAEKTLDGKPAIPLRNARLSFNTFSMSTSFYREIFQSWASILWHRCLQLWCQTLLSILLLSTTHQFASNNFTQQKHVFFKIFFSVVQLRNLGHCEKECQTRNSAVSSSKLYTYLLSCQVDIRRFCQRVLFSVKHVFFQLFFKSIPVNNRDLLIQDSWSIDWWLWAFQGVKGLVVLKAPWWPKRAAPEFQRVHQGSEKNWGESPLIEEGFRFFSIYRNIIDIYIYR